MTFASLTATRVLATAQVGRWLVSLEWKLPDLWVGIFFTADEAWICLAPCLPIHIRRIR